jgi:predicted ATPase/class 3 adenylate cyclase/Tfp pilus assembly protein PilF
MRIPPDGTTGAQPINAQHVGAQPDGALPSGTVTFLYTDIEGSTKRWEQHPAIMKAAVERHDALLREAIAAGGGYVFRTMGDAFCASFPTAKQALTAAVAAQFALFAEPWREEIAPLRVRMALHSGTGEVRDGDYIGRPLNRVARLLAVGSGGQILISRTTHELVGEALPADVVLRDLGEHRLKDLQQPERIFEVVAAGLPVDYPPLKTLDCRPNNLPARQSSLIGREDEMVAAQRLLLKDNAGLLTLTGPGGVGKTRLALQLAAEVIEEFQDGTYLVDLTPVQDRALVPSAIAQALGVREVARQPIIESLREHLRDKQMLLVLDNFEHVVQAAGLVAQLLTGAPRLRILATSRAALRIRGEQELALPPLRLPDTRRARSTQPASSLNDLARNASVALFVERAQLAKPDFELTAQNASAVAQICVRLDGLPLAIELAAARIRLLPPQAMLERLEKRLRLLTSGARDLPAHQQTMRDAIAWSYELLSPEEQKLFYCVSVFAGGCALEAVEAVCNADGRLNLDTLDGMAALVDKSLLLEAESQGEARFSMLETIREFGLERLEASGEAESIQRQYVSYFLQLALKGGRRWAYQPIEQTAWVESLNTEQSNLRAAIEWSLRNDTEAALRFCNSLSWPWIWRGNISEMSNWLERALALPDASSKPEYAPIVLAAGVLATFGSNYAMARSRIEQALSLLDSSADRDLINDGLGFLVMVVSMQGAGSGAAADITSQAVERLNANAREAGDAISLVSALTGLGIAYYFRGEYKASRDALEGALAEYRVLGKDAYAPRIMTLLADLYRIEGDHAAAGPLYEEALVVLREVGVRNEVSSILHGLGYVALAGGDSLRAKALFEESLSADLELEDRGGIIEAVAGLAAVAREEGHPERAIRLYGAAKALWDANRMAMWPAERAEYERNTSVLRAQVDEARWQKAWAEGSAMGMEQATEYALRAHIEPE